MFSKINFLTLASASFLIVTVLSTNNPELIINKFNEKIFDFIAGSENINQRSSDNFLECFEEFQNNMKIVNNKYTTSHQACVTNADDKRSAVELESSISRNNLSNRTQESCDALDLCKKIETVKEFYECYEIMGNNKAKVLQNVSSEAAYELANYNEKVRVIQNNKYLCTNSSQNTYVIESDYELECFKNCTNGRNPNPTPILNPSSDSSSY